MTKYLDQIIKIVSETTEVSIEDIKSKSRKESVSFARKLVIEFCYRFGISTSAIADYLHRSQDGIRKLYISLIQYSRTKVEAETERVIADKLNSIFVDNPPTA